MSVKHYDMKIAIITVLKQIIDQVTTRFINVYPPW